MDWNSLEAVGLFDTQEVGGSRPPVPTIQCAENTGPDGDPVGAFDLYGASWLTSG